jgi:hypothetical protein
MERIASPQYEALGRAYGERFVAQACERLRALHAERLAAVPEDTLQAFVRRGIERCQGHGLVVERDILRFIDCQLRFGAEFDRDPAYATESAASATAIMSATAVAPSITTTKKPGHSTRRRTR